MIDRRSLLQGVGLAAVLQAPMLVDATAMAIHHCRLRSAETCMRWFFY